MSCVRCGSTDMQKSHFIPKALVKDILSRSSGGTQDLKMLLDDAVAILRFQKTGYWDDKILCRSCDGRLNDLRDKDFISFVRKIGSSDETMHDGYCTVTLGNLSYEGIALAAGAIVWRMAVSTVFPGINLGPNLRLFEKASFSNSSFVPSVLVVRRTSSYFEGTSRDVEAYSGKTEKRDPFSGSRMHWVWFSVGGLDFYVSTSANPSKQWRDVSIMSIGRLAEPGKLVLPLVPVEDSPVFRNAHLFKSVQRHFERQKAS